MSRQHARIDRLSDSGFSVTCLSKNNVLIDKQLLTPGEDAIGLEDGNRVVIGSTVFIFETVSE